MTPKKTVHLKLSGSSSSLATHCSHWISKEVEKEADNEVSAEGTRLHALAECILKGEVTREELSHSSDVQVWKRCKELMDLPKFMPLKIEESYAVNLTTLDVRTIDLDARDHVYGQHQVDEVPCTIDLIYSYQSSDGKTYIVAHDWKFGPAGLSGYTATGSAQLALAGAVAQSLACIGDEIRGAFMALDGTVSATDWGDMVQTLERLKAKLNDREPYPGDHCTLCKYRKQCSAGMTALTAPVTDMIGHGSYRLSNHIESPAHALWTCMAVRRAERILGDIKDAVKAYATDHPVIDKDGRIYEQREFEGSGVTIQAASFSDEQIAQWVAEGKAVPNKGRKVWNFYKPRGVK